MTAEEVRSVIFQNAKIGGYKKSDVDLFLEEVAVCIESMTAKIRALEKEKFNAGKLQQNITMPVEELKPVHYKQLLTYLKLMDKPVGLWINFNVNDLMDGIKRVRNGYDEEVTVS